MSVRTFRRIFRRAFAVFAPLTISASLFIAPLAHAEGDAATGSSGGGGNVKSGLFVEPGISYQQGNTKGNFALPWNSDQGSINGFGILGRVGFHINEAFFVALDARYGIPHFKDNEVVNYSANAKSYQLGPVVGLQMPVAGLRVWAGYIATAVLDPDASSNVDVKFEDGYGYHVGVGFHVSAVSLNLEYEDIQYNTTQVQSTFGTNIGTGNYGQVKLHSDALIASVTFPLEL